MKEKTVLQGVIADIIYHNKENGYIVAVFDTEEEEVTLTGYLPVCHEGRSYEVKGEYKNHPKYGEQFAFDEATEIMPSSKEGIAEFLASGVVKGIGPKAAKEIVDYFGEKTFEVIENTPLRLMEVKGIGEVKANTIYESYLAHKEFAEISVYLQQFGINARYAMKLYAVYGGDTIKAIEENPYQLTTDLFGVGFKKADAIAEKMGIDKEDDNRVQSGIRYTLGYMVSEGHSFLTQEELMEKAGEILEVSRELIEDHLVDLAFSGYIKIDNLAGRRVIYPMPYYLAEQYVTAKLADLKEADITPIWGKVEDVVARAEVDCGVEFSEEQKAAIEACIHNGVTVITGGPGTGKTTIINGIIRIFEENEIETAICAPTGRAAKRITQTTGREASTIHRLLEYAYSEGSDEMVFGRDEENPLTAQAIIVDEASMVDILLMQGLLKAVKTGARLVLVGDADQLPSVGAGNVLSDILNCEYIYSVQLKEIYRQAQESLIIVNAHKINKGEYPDFNEKDKDFFFLQHHKEQEMLDVIVDLCLTRLPKAYKLANPVEDIQVISPTRRGLLGTINLNKELQKKLNPRHSAVAEKAFGEKVFREGDKVMQIKNNYQLHWKSGDGDEEGDGVFNGDVGYILSINNEDGYMVICFDDRYVKYDYSLLEELELAYAVTVHKSQGSEFPIVIMPMTWFPPVLATRNLIYTGITRAKDMVVLVGSPNRMCAMVDNNYIAARNSGLRDRLGALL